ncbi:hypothetical protein M569_00486 [Genlisea aurea]|uniref:RNA helicase n=1 Tax=Genlisea aurea TaxID=192259 RepID=S8ENA8_9LAMI|nr:hypothetical protein M569_00486 [Genlisea aurea]
MGKRKRELRMDAADQQPGESSVEEGQSFEKLGLDPSLTGALSKKSIEIPTPIQCAAIPLILEGKCVVAVAKTGSGKTLGYLLPLLHKLIGDSPSTEKLAPSAIILVPSREICHQVFSELKSLIESCSVQLKAVQLTSAMSSSELKKLLAGLPDIVVSTPACVKTCLADDLIQSKALQESLSILVLDEADLLLSYGYEDDLTALSAHVPESCQCLLISATSSDDVEKLKKLILHNPYILTLPESGDAKDDTIPNRVQQFHITCSAQDKLLHIFALLKLELVQKKVLIFTNTIDMGFRMKLFLEQFGLKSLVLNAELPQNSRRHIIQEFNAGLFDYLIATDDRAEKPCPREKSKKHSKGKSDSQFGLVKGIILKNVHAVINFDMPHKASEYAQRIGLHGRGYDFHASVSLVSPKEMGIFEEIKSLFGENNDEDSKFIAPFPLLSRNAVESFRYRAEDVARSVTRDMVIRERARVLRNEILNSEKLKAHFKDNPKDLDLLKQDKALTKKAPASHLRNVPDYLLDPATQEVSKILKLSRAAMGNTGGGGGGKRFKRKSRRSRDDPLSKAYKRTGKEKDEKKRKSNSNEQPYHTSRDE